MSSLAFLVTELQSLSSETRRKYPEIREAAEKSLAIIRASPEALTANLAADGPQSDELLRPVFLGCATKNAKVVAIALGSLQRLIALKAVPQSAVPVIISTMSDAVSQGVDIQLRVLQAGLSLITNFPTVHGDLLGDALLLCFKLQDSRIAVVSSTAAATLRQLVMFVVDKVNDEDQQELSPESLSLMTLPNGQPKELGPAACDAYSVFQDLCLLANSERPHFLKLEFLHKTFALELIESVLTNYHDLFRKHAELLLLLQHHLCPLLLKALSDRPVFALTLRCTRVVFLLLKQFSFELQTEAEVFLMLLIKTIGEDDHNFRPQWMRVLAMEIMRGLCSDSELVRNVWQRYDGHESVEGETGSNVFASLITALKRLVTEKPVVLGVGTQMNGVGIQGPAAEGSLETAKGMVATAASATMSMMGSGVGLSAQGSAMKLQCIDQLDKADAPPIPEAYIYLLGVQCLASLCEGFASFAGPLYSSIVIQKPRAAGEAVIRAPPALDLSTLPAEDPTTSQLAAVSAMVESGWPALLAALSFIISTNLSDELFADVLSSYQAMTNVSGMLGLVTPRDAFITSLAKLAIPTRVVSSLDSYIEPSTPRTASSFSENLGLTGPTQSPGLSERNSACLKVLIASALFLAGSLGESWFGVLEALQNADYVLTAKGVHGTPSKRNTMSAGGPGTRIASGTGIGGLPGSPSQPKVARSPLLSDLDSESLKSAIQRLFDGSKNLEDSAYKDFIDALCRLSAEMVGMQKDGSGMLTESESFEDVPNVGLLSPRTEKPAHRRRASGIHLPRTLRAGDFGINKLGDVSMLNIHRLIYRAPEVAWNTTTSHLLSVIRLPTAPQTIRVQAARVLDEILIVVPRNLSSTGELQAQVQRRVIDVLSQQIIPDVNSGDMGSSTSVELRRKGMETLHHIVQASGHTLVVGWETIFEMLGSVCKPAPPSRLAAIDEVPGSPSSPRAAKPPPLGYSNERGQTTLVKIAFQSLTLVCDSVSSLSAEHLRLCIGTLGQFGRQADTNIALTAAESLLWSVSDSIQSKRKDAEKEPEYSALWMSLLLEVLGLCGDSRPEVRVGAISTLFRTMQLYGATLSPDTWEECIWKVTFPLLDSITAEMRHHSTDEPDDPSLDHVVVSPSQAWDDSKILALQSIGSIFHEFLTSKIMRLASFTKAWDAFVNYIQDAVLLDNRRISAPALRCLEKSMKASSLAGKDLRDMVSSAWERVWEACDHMGASVLVRSSAGESAQRPFTQESLVAYVDVIRSTRETSRKLEGTEWPLERLSRLMAVLKGVLTYPNSPDYRPDTDALTPVQSVVLDAISGVDLTVPGGPSLVMRDLSEYATLPFLAAFDTPTVLPAPAKRITYIALTKKAMPLLVELYLKHKTSPQIYSDGTLEAVLSAYSIPVKMKYDCPPASKFGKDPPLWKTATTSFLQIVNQCASQIRTLGSDIPDAHVEGIWRQVLDVFRGSILADCSIVETFSLEKQEAEENFDLALIAALEIDVVPHLGDPRVPDCLVAQFAKVLQQGSRVYESLSSPIDKGKRRESDEFEKIDIGTDYSAGSTDLGPLAPRERFSYWCFDLLFLVCSNTAQDQEPARRRMAALCLPHLLNRCKLSLVGYVADESLRGNLPFPRAREDELLYILRKLRDLRLWPGTLWAALSDSPSKFSIGQPAPEATSTPSQIIADAVKRSSVAHLFHFYPVLCEIASIPRKAPSTWSSSPGKPVVAEVDAREIARDSLKDIGREMGVAR